MAALDARTTAFALDPARIYLHRKDRFPGGGLAGDEADDLAGEIGEELLELRHDGEVVGPDVDGPPLLAAVHRAADAYSGPLLHRAPDLVAVGAPACSCAAPGAAPGCSGRTP